MTPAATGPRPALKPQAVRCASSGVSSASSAAGAAKASTPPLAGNRSVNLLAPHNVIQALCKGGFAPNTTANPRPVGMC
jgi:hypothetical protein